MKSILILLALLSFNLGYAAESIISSIHKIDVPSSPDEETLLFLTNGLVVKVPSGISLKNLTSLSGAYAFSIAGDRYVQSMRLISDVHFPLLSNKFTSIDHNFDPTVLISENEAMKLFKTFRKNAKPDSQCYNRSHVWAYETWKNTGISSMKAFIFFTRKYIRDFNFKWWFHNAPMVYLFKRGERKELVLDPEFAGKPLGTEDWATIFLKRGMGCAEIAKYSDYELNQESQYCYIMKESMYYYQPLDLDRQEHKRTFKSDWIDWEVKNAFSQGFGLL